MRGVAGRDGRSLAVALSGLAVVTAVLASTVLGSAAPAPPAAEGRSSGAGSGHGAVGARADAERSPALRAAPEPETCADGEDPAASLKPSAGSGPAVTRIKQRGRLVVGVDQNSYLWGYRDPSTGRIEGFDIDLVQAIATDLLGPDPDVTYKTIPTDQRVTAVQDGDVDMVVRAMTVNCERIRQVAFSTAYFEAGQQLVVPKEKARVTGFNESMRGKRLCVAAGSTAETLMRSEGYRGLGAKILVVDNQLDCLVRMQLGGTDATLTDSALGAGQAAQDPSVELIGEPETIEPYGVAMNRADEDLVRRVNKVLDDYRDSKWRASYEKWLADNMVGTQDGKRPSPPEPKYRD
ncbi:glutamate ABC transporter substrate-binding protein [Streptomyces sp. HNM0574]|nr:glutamate ABC transporter substrate-binding protein [Streptomyces sp. HNM0574]NLU66415.1 glutamate ABC transporter substrate-binding protein [Streptomyces sp. HNM0574]